MALPEGLQLFCFSLEKFISSDYSLWGGGWVCKQSHKSSHMPFSRPDHHMNEEKCGCCGWTEHFTLFVLKAKDSVWCWKPFHLQGEGEGRMDCLCSLTRTMLGFGRGECIWDFVNTYCSQVNINRNTHPTLSAKISLLRAPRLYFYLWDHHERMSPKRDYKTFLQLWGLYSLIK